MKANFPYGNRLITILRSSQSRSAAEADRVRGKRDRMYTSSEEDISLYIVTELYFEHRLNQYEIAKRLDGSDMKFSRMLKTAKEKGIVKITIQRRLPRVLDLEQELEKQYKFHKTIVVHAKESTYLLSLCSKPPRSISTNCCSDPTSLSVSESDKYVFQKL